jgi:hypothetical protein
MKVSFETVILMRKFLPAMVIFQLGEGEKWGINETTIK